jgi:hypothetical protein
MSAQASGGSTGRTLPASTADLVPVLDPIPGALDP